MVWAVSPHNRAAIDPLLGPVTGVGYRNAGDTLGAAQFGHERGFHQERQSGQQQPRPWAQRIPHSPARFSVPPVAVATLASDTVEALERLQSMRDNGVLSPDEFKAAKRRVLG